MLDATCLLPQAAYGVNLRGELITIEEVTSGKTNLVCPFCDRDPPLQSDRGLTAKRKIKQHHFAHTGETCLRVRKGKLPSLPLYDNFHLQLSAKHFQLLKDLWREYGHTNYAIITVLFELEMKKLCRIGRCLRLCDPIRFDCRKVHPLPRS